MLCRIRGVLVLKVLQDTKMTPSFGIWGWAAMAVVLLLVK